jgi:hypothetical protein
MSPSWRWSVNIVDGMGRQLLRILPKVAQDLLGNLLATAVLIVLGIIGAGLYGLLRYLNLRHALTIVVVSSAGLALVWLAALGARRASLDLRLYYEWLVPRVVDAGHAGPAARRRSLVARRLLLWGPHGQRRERRLREIASSYVDETRMTEWDFGRWDAARSARPGRPTVARSRRYPTLIWPQHLDRPRYWPDPSFRIRVVYGTESVRVVKDGSCWELTVDLSRSAMPLGIYANAGKAKLLELYRNQEADERLVHESTRLHRLLMGEVGSGSFTWDSRRLGPLRWSSAGVLAVVSGVLQTGDAREHWALLFFRDIPPIGWNVANGASETTRELSNLQNLIDRELVEELMVLSHEPRPGGEDVEYLGLRPSRGRLSFDSKYLDGCRAARLAHDDIRIVDSDPRRWLAVAELGSPLTVRVRNASGTAFTRGREEQFANVYFSINGLERGIEVIRLYQFNVEPGTYFLDGELFPWRPAPAALVRRPIVLLRVGWLREVFERNGGSLGELVQSTDMKRLPPIPSDARRPFMEDVSLRRRRRDALRQLLGGESAGLREGERRMRERELRQIEAWLRRYERKFAALAGREDVVDLELRQLCPVTWKTLELALRHGYL